MPRGVPNRGYRLTAAAKRRIAAGQQVSPIRLVSSIPSVQPSPKMPSPLGSPLLVTVAPAVEETDEQIDARIAERFSIVDDLAEAAIAGDARALVISGPAGVGKSFSIESKLKAHDPNGLNYTIAKGKALATGIYKLLWEHREEGQVILFDDCDTIFFDDASLNLLKSACDTTELRRICWHTEYEFVDKDGMPIPRNFEFNGTVIFITNYNFDRMIEKQNKLAPHLQALMSRAHYVDTGMETARDCLIRIKQVCRQGMLTDQGLNSEQEKEVLDFLAQNLYKLREVSLRMAIKVAALRRRQPKKWQDLAKVTCFKKGV